MLEHDKTLLLAKLISNYHEAIEHEQTSNYNANQNQFAILSKMLGKTDFKTEVSQYVLRQKWSVSCLSIS